MHLDPDRVKLLKALSVERRLPKSMLMREAIEDLLIKYGKLRPPRSKT
jgi:hypothetical protein